MTQSQTSKNINLGSLAEYDKNLKQMLFNKDINITEVNKICAEYGLNPVSEIIYIQPSDLKNIDLNWEYNASYIIYNKNLFEKFKNCGTDPILVYFPTTFKENPENYFDGTFTINDMSEIVIRDPNFEYDDCYWTHDLSRMRISSLLDLGFNLLYRYNDDWFTDFMNPYGESVEYLFEKIPLNQNYSTQIKTLIVNKLPTNPDPNTIYYILEEEE